MADGYSCQSYKEVAPKSNGQLKKLACDCVHGDCIGGKCKCSIGWSGSRCDQGKIINSSLIRMAVYSVQQVVIPIRYHRYISDISAMLDVNDHTI